MELFDTHCHFECPEAEIAPILLRAAQAGVTRIMAIGGSDSLNSGALAAVRVASGNPEMPRVSLALGFDRDQASRDSLPQLDRSRACAVGEIGLDYHYDGAPHEKQRALFSSELELARELDLPVVIHTREADDDTLAILKEIPSRGIIHSFTGSADFCRKLLDLGFMISISGIVTFRAADNVREMLRVVPNDHLLIETDSPFLAPVPKRGKVNEPAFVVHTAKFIADLRGMAIEDFARLTTDNAIRALAPGAEG